MAHKGRIDRMSKITLADDEKEFVGNVVEGTKSSITEQHKPTKKGDKHNEFYKSEQ